MAPRFRYFGSREAARAAAPQDVPWTVVDVAAPPKEKILSVPELLKLTVRPMIEVPYPHKRKSSYR